MYASDSCAVFLHMYRKWQGKRLQELDISCYWVSFTTSGLWLGVPCSSKSTCHHGLVYLILHGPWNPKFDVQVFLGSIWTPKIPFPTGGFPLAPHDISFSLVVGKESSECQGKDHQIYSADQLPDANHFVWIRLQSQVEVMKILRLKFSSREKNRLKSAGKSVKFIPL